MKINSIAIDKLIPYHNNPRKDQAVDKVASSINEYGFQQPIVVDKNMVVVVGHTRLMGAKKLGLKKVPTVIADLSETQAKAYRIADNRINEDSTWDMELLNLEIAGLSEVDFDLDLLGFDSSELDKLLVNDEEYLTDEDEVPEPPKEPKSKLGDVYELGEHRLMCGDSTSIDAVDKLMNNEKANVLFTDPPYGIGLDKNEQTLGKSKKYNAVLNDDNNNVAKEVFNLVSNLRFNEIYFWGANHYSSVLPDSSCWIVWDKQGGKSVTYADCELCYTNIKKPVRMFTHIWDGFRRDSEKNKERVHPTQKPIQLFIDIWDKFETGKFILDLFGGSGSTLIACQKTNRKCYMMELDPKYVDVIIERWENFTGKKAKKIC